MRTDFPEIIHSDDPDKASYMFIGMWIFLGVCNKTLPKCCRSKIRTWGIFYMPFGICDVNREHVTPRNRHPFVDFCKNTLAAFGSKDCLHQRVWYFYFCDGNIPKALLLPLIRQIVIFHTYIEMIWAYVFSIVELTMKMLISLNFIIWAYIIWVDNFMTLHRRGNTIIS